MTHTNITRQGEAKLQTLTRDVELQNKTGNAQRHGTDTKQREHRTKLKELKSLNHSTQQEQTRTQDYNNKKHKALDQKTQDHDPATSSLASWRTLVVTKPL